MKVLLTGGRGMVGRNLRDHPAAARHEIIAPASAELDLTDRRAVFEAVAAWRPDVVIHAAGKVGGIQANVADPVGFFVDNLDMGVNVVLAARAARVPRLLNIGSSCMYPRAAPNPLREDMLLTGELEPTNEGYALAKIGAARLCSYISRSDPNLAYRTVVPCNLYGPHDKFDPAVSHLVPAIIRKVHEAKVAGAAEVEIWGDGEARREFMYSGDLADGIWRAVERFDELPDLMNMGVGRDHTVNEYYRAVADVIGWSGRFTHDLSRPVGMARKLVSVERQEAFGWSPATSLQEGVALTYAYFLSSTSQPAPEPVAP